MSNAIIFTIAVFLIGLVLGALIIYIGFTWRPDGLFIVNLHNVDEEMFKMQIDIPLEKMPEVKYLIFKVVKTGQ